jgi:arylsulfatase A-like enzyme
MYDPAGLTLLPGWTDACLPADLAFRPGYFDNTTLTESALRRVMAYYYATISQIDAQVGRMLDVLKAKGLYDNTLVVYNSDHGEYLGFHHLLLKGNRMYDPLIKVPLIVKFPGQARAGEVSDELVNSLDVGPTLLGWAGCDAPKSWAGADLTDGIDRQVIFAESGRGHEYMARTQTRKLLLTADPAQSLFFDLQSDPLEMDNRFHDPACQAEIADLREHLLHWALFDQPSPVHLDEAAPIIAGANVYQPADPDAQRERAERVAYFAQRNSQ